MKKTITGAQTDYDRIKAAIANGHHGAGSTSAELSSAYWELVAAQLRAGVAVTAPGA